MDAMPDDSRPVAGWLRCAIVGAGLVVFALFWLKIARLEPGEKIGDFALHWEFGRRIVAGEFIYDGGHDVPYPPFWAVMHAPLSAVSGKTAQLVMYPLFLVALAGLVVVLRKLTAAHIPLNRQGLFWTTALAILFSARYLIRDLPEVGVNLALVAVSWGAVWLWTRRREWLGGAVLGVAISLKCTPALFWAWFVLKRQWKMAGITAAAVVAFSLSPRLIQGEQQFARATEYWLFHVKRSVTADDPSHGVLGPLQLQNMSLKSTLARYLMALPEGHPGRADHPLYVDVLSLDAATANQVIRYLLIALVLWGAFRLKSAVTDRSDPALLHEWAAVSVTIPLLSPITWGQHCVAVLPALYLLFARRMGGQPFDFVTRCWLGAWTLFVLVLFGDAVGASISRLLQSYHVETMCIAGLLWLTLRDHRRWLMSSSEEARPETLLMANVDRQAA